MRKTILTSVISSLITAAILALAARTRQVDFLGLFGVPKIETGQLTINEEKSYSVKFKTKFSKTPSVVFGASYTTGKAESFASMTSEATKEGFDVRLVDVNGE